MDNNSGENISYTSLSICISTKEIVQINNHDKIVQFLHRFHHTQSARQVAHICQWTNCPSQINVHTVIPLQYTCIWSISSITVVTLWWPLHGVKVFFKAGSVELLYYNLNKKQTHSTVSFFVMQCTIYIYIYLFFLDSWKRIRMSPQLLKCKQVLSTTLAIWINQISRSCDNAIKIECLLMSTLYSWTPMVVFIVLVIGFPATPRTPTSIIILHKIYFFYVFSSRYLHHRPWRQQIFQFLKEITYRYTLWLLHCNPKIDLCLV